MKQILVVSPHLDDAILSCGTYIVRSVKEKNAVTIATVFSGSIEADRYSPLAKWFHGICGLGDNAMEVRCIEDKKACSFLRAKCIHLNLQECLYRFNSDGCPRYPEEKSIYNTGTHNEQDTVTMVCTELMHQMQLDAFDEILIPVGIGRHIDHIVVREAVEALKARKLITNSEIMYYEDIPYACANRNKYWKDELVFNFTAKPYKISETDFSTYINALCFYKSQIDMLWENKTEMIKQLKRHYLKNYSRILSGSLYKEAAKQ